MTEPWGGAGDGTEDRGDSYAYLVRAKRLADHGRPADSREAVEWALAHAAADDADVLVLAGVVLLALGDAHAALATGLRAHEADPGGWEPYVLTADAYRLLGRTADAVVAARRAVSLAPREAEARVSLARALGATRGLRGIPRAHRAELAENARLAVELGAAPDLVTPATPRWPTLLPIAVAVAALIALPAAGALAVVVGLGLLAAAALGLRIAEARAAGTSPVARLHTMRAVARAELAADPGRARAAVAHATAALPALPLPATGLACAAGAEGRPWPLWAVTGAAAAVPVAAALGARLLSWWYGPAFTRVYLRPARPLGYGLAAVIVLGGASVAQSALAPSAHPAWALLFAAHALSLATGITAAAITLARLNRT
jgi:hypothetical protein